MKIYFIEETKIYEKYKFFKKYVFFIYYFKKYSQSYS